MGKSALHAKAGDTQRLISLVEVDKRHQLPHFVGDLVARAFNPYLWLAL
jgi:hypothetical protein